MRHALQLTGYPVPRLTNFANLNDWVHGAVSPTEPWPNICTGDKLTSTWRPRVSGVTHPSTEVDDLHRGGRRPPQVN